METECSGVSDTNVVKNLNRILENQQDDNPKNLRKKEN